MLQTISSYSRTHKLIIASGVIGNLLETFDVMLCAFFARIIATSYFPPQLSTKNYLFSIFNIFLVGYLSKPIGSLFIGLYADQIGRKKTLIFSIFMVGLCTALIGVIPSYESIGISSAILFLLLRILQNVSVGGEYISSIAYLIESAKQNNRGFFGSWIAVGLNSGTLLASLFAFIWIYLIDVHVFPEWSWRLIFMIAIMGMAIGMWIRYSLPESREFILENSMTKIPKKWSILKTSFEYIKINPYLCLSLFAITWLGVCETSAIFIYSPIHMTTINHLSQHAALGINTLSLLLLIILIPVFGMLSDRYDQIKLLSIASISFIALAIPYFWYLSYGSYLQILGLKLLFSIPSACFYAIAPVLITEKFPAQLRCTGLALIYQVAASIAAGLAPIIILYLVYYHQAQFPYSPAYFIIIISLFCLMGLYYLKKLPTTYLESIKNKLIIEIT